MRPIALALLGANVALLTCGPQPVPRLTSADLAVIDGVIQAVDRTGMEVEVHARTGAIFVQRVDFSAHVIFGAPAAAIVTTRGDLAAGRAIGMVVYRPPTGPLRATRIWLD